MKYFLHAKHIQDDQWTLIYSSNARYEVIEKMENEMSDDQELDFVFMISRTHN